MKKLILMAATLFVFSTSSLCSASGIQDTIGEDKIAHAAVSYVICDQLKHNAGFNDFWAAITTLAIGAVKEGLIDDHWDAADFAADCAGVAFYHFTF